MINTLFTAIFGIVGLMVLWMLVQAAWRRAFTDYINDEDVLAQRRSCGNCGCSTACQRPVSNLPKKA